MVDQGIGHTPDVERVGQRNRRLDLAQLAHLLEAARLAVAVDRVHGGGDFVAEEVAGMGQDHRDAGARRTGAGHQRAVAEADGRLAYLHAGDVGDGIPRAGRQAPEVVQTQGASAQAGVHSNPPKKHANLSAVKDAKRLALVEMKQPGF